MRIQKEQAEFIKQSIRRRLPDASVYLFGSRANELERGGDVDILVIAGRTLTTRENRSVKIEYYKQFGEQKIDIVSFEKNAYSTFKELALLEAVSL